MGLEEYKRKRRFNETPEPAGQVKENRGNSFVIQKHRATRLHYDFRIEMEGVLRSWAIPKGPSLNPSEKRLAVLTEDHPIDYGDFEGTIPKGNYGAGKVIIWDHGTYEMVDPETPEKGWQKGKFHFVLKGKKLNGEWVLVRGSRAPNDWIFELKMDGVRALVVKNGPKLDMWTRNANDLTRRFPTLAEAFADLPVDTVILDGEIVALDEKGHSHFNLIQPRIHLSRARDIAAAEERIPVYFYAFDVLYLNGYNIMKF